LVVLVRRHCHTVRAAVRRAVDDEISSAIKEETGPAAVRRVSFFRSEQMSEEKVWWWWWWWKMIPLCTRICPYPFF